jgi:hypothetical protein
VSTKSGQVHVAQDSSFRPVRDLAEVMDFLAANRSVQRLRLGERVQLAPKGATWSLEALSPSVEDERRLLAAIVAVLPSSAVKNTQKLNLNAGCAVLRVEAEGFRIMISSDLEAGNDGLFGWRNIVAQNRGNLRAHLATVGHHGSPTAYLDEAWREMGDPAMTFSVSTLFPVKDGSLPRQEVLKKVQKRSRGVFLTGHPGSNAKSAVQVPRKSLPFSSYTPLHAGSDPGQVRFRYRKGATEPVVEIFPPAHMWNP